MQNQSPSTTQILTRNFEQAFDRVNDLIFGPIPIWNWRFLSPLQLFRRQLSQIPLLKSCFGPHNAKRSKLSNVLRHCLLRPNAVALAILSIFFHFGCHGILCSMLRHWSYCQFAEFCQCHGNQCPMPRHPIHLSNSLFVLSLFFLLSIPMLELSSAT